MNSSERSHEISTRKKPATRDGRPRVHPLWSNGRWKDYPVCTVPVEALLLNVDNKRFAAARTLVEQELGRPLDPENNPIDEQSIISMLLDKAWRVDQDRVIGSPSKDYEALRADWQARQQADPLWIRPDGTVRNGNRRLAMLKRMRAEGVIADWVEVVIVEPSDVDEAELFRMEQNEQLAEDYKIRYDKIDLLLALKEAAQLEGIDWLDPQSVDHVAGILKHFAGKDDKAYAATQLRAIRAIDTYLDYLGYPGQYHFVMQERQVEVFREVGKFLQLGDEYPDDVEELVQTAFAAVQAGMNYLDLRTLRKQFIEDRDEFLKVAARVRGEEEEAGWPSDYVETSGVDTVDTEILTAEEDEEEPAPPPASASDYPKAAVRPHLQRAVDKQSTLSLDVHTQLQQAANRLNAVSSRDLANALSENTSAHVVEALAAISAWIESNHVIIDGAIASSTRQGSKHGD